MKNTNGPSCRGILFLGAPGSGKGTQSRAIGQLPGFFWFGAGAALRSLDSASELGQQVQGFLESGDLVPRDLVFQVWRRHLDEAVAAGAFDFARDTVLFDGFPRGVAQAEMLESYVDWRLIVHLNSPEDELLKERLRRRDARPDDRDDAVIDHRFAVYHERTEALLQHFSNTEMASVNATASPLEVLAEVARAICQSTEQRV